LQGGILSQWWATEGRGEDLAEVGWSAEVDSEGCRKEILSGEV